MKTTSIISQLRALPKALRLPCVTVLLPVLLLLLGVRSGRADSATWSSNPPDLNLWSDFTNWVPQTEPNGPNDTATFANSAQTFIDIDFFNDGSVEVDGINYVPGADAFTISNVSAFLYFEGFGITNNSGVAQNFLASGAFGTSYFIFDGVANAGSMTVFTMIGGSSGNSGNTGSLSLNDQSSGGSGSFIVQAGNGTNRVGGRMSASSSATLDHATVTLSGGNNSGKGGTLTLSNSSTAAHSTLIANGGSNGGAGGILSLTNDSLGGDARVQVSGNGELDISGHNAPGVAIGAIGGDGLVFLGANNLTVGNGLSSIFSGVIQDGGASGGTGGSLAKEGDGKLTLSGANTYSGGTVINQGTLSVANLAGSATGTGPVQVDHGTLAGTGNIAGAVIVGTGAAGAFLAPGAHGRIGNLSLQNMLAFNSRATYDVDLDSATATADRVDAFGVTVSNGARVAIDDLGSRALSSGTVFTIINNTAASAIAGTFRNLPDNSIFAVGANTYLVSYEGGDGNDLTLTVVP